MHTVYTAHSTQHTHNTQTRERQREWGEMGKRERMGRNRKERERQREWGEMEKIEREREERNGKETERMGRNGKETENGAKWERTSLKTRYVFHGLSSMFICIFKQRFFSDSTLLKTNTNLHAKIGQFLKDKQNTFRYTYKQLSTVPFLVGVGG